jgi:hypothetical protein
MSGRAWRPLGFLLLMFGFGFRLDTDWQGLAWALLVLGALAAAGGLVRRPDSRPSAFVPPPDAR